MMLRTLLTFLALFLCVSCFLLENQKPTSDHDLIRYLDHVVTNLVNLTGKLGTDIATKNDLTQFLQSDLQQLNLTLQEEKQKRQTLETKVTQLETSLASVKASSGELKAELLSTKARTNTLQNDLLAAKQEIDALNYTLNSTKIKQANDSGRLTNSLGILQSNVDQIKNQTDKRSYFSLRNSVRIPPNGLRFSGVLENYGDGYNTTSGTFIVPYNGVYLFSLTLGVTTDTYTSCYIVRNRYINLVETFTSIIRGYCSSTTSTVVHLLKGDHITVDNCHGNGTFSPYKTSFLGSLLRAD